MKNNIFIRSKLNPILKPNPKNTWENFKLYNPGVIYFNNQFHLYYRAVGQEKNWQSAIGYAVSGDGEHFKRFKKPLLKGEGLFEKRGLEDPRVTKINNNFYMAYAAYDGTTPRLSVAISKNLKDWKKYGPCLTNFSFENADGVFMSWKNGELFKKTMKHEWSKAGGIFPEKINNKYWMLFGEYRIWKATSKDGKIWQADKKPFLKPRSGNFFDNTYVEMGPPPIKTKLGWLVIYHGIDNKMFYRLGYLLLDLKNPNKILFRGKNPIFGPEKKYETQGPVDIISGGIKMFQKLNKKEKKSLIQKLNKNNLMPKVVFCCGAVLIKDVLRIYYGAGDSVICTATASLNKILKSK